MGILWAVVALVALGVVAGIIGWCDARSKARKLALGIEVEENECTTTIAGGCCGMHMTCERDSLLAAVSPRIVYYDDEELDRYRGRDSHTYEASEVEEFRDILITLHEDEVAGWVRSLQLRELAIPEELKPEIYLIIGESRAYHLEHGPGSRH